MKNACYIPGKNKKGILFSNSHVQAVEVVLEDLRGHGSGHTERDWRRHVGASSGHLLLRTRQVTCTSEHARETGLITREKSLICEVVATATKDGVRYRTTSKCTASTAMVKSFHWLTTSLRNLTATSGMSTATQ